MKRLLIALLGAQLLLPIAYAAAQTYPNKPIKFVIPFGPGTITDTLARMLANDLSPDLGQPMVIVNRAGADGTIGATEVKRSAPDGYTLLFASNSPIPVAPLLRKEPPYDPIADFTPISFLGNTTFFIAVNPTIPAQSLAELIAYAKANPRKINYGTGNTTSIVSAALFGLNNGIELVHVPYKAEPEAIIDLLSGQIHLMFGSLTTLGPHVRDGKLRALSTLLPSRSPLLPDVPSITEAGQKPFEVGPWGALVGPAGLPPDIVKRLNAAVRTSLAKPELRDQMLKQGFAPEASSPEELGAFFKDQVVKWRKALADAKLEPQ
jgi:tripartite-type tricarboxylate transporter receptor subunit TctC